MHIIYSELTSSRFYTYIRISAAAPLALTALKDLLFSSSLVQEWMEKSDFFNNIMTINTTTAINLAKEPLATTHFVIAIQNALELILDKNPPVSKTFLMGASFSRGIQAFIGNQSADRLYAAIWTAGSFFTTLEAFKNKRATTAQKAIPLVYTVAGAINLLALRFAALRSPVVQQLAVIAPFVAALFATYKKVPDPSFQIANPSVLK